MMIELKSLSNEEITRYSRHILVPDIGLEGQKQISAAKILVIGAGGLGSPVLMYLAASGVGELGICDFDVVDTTNLQRQIIHNENTVGVNKANSAAQFIQLLNPYVKVNIHNIKLTSDNIQKIFIEYDIIIDACDNFQTRYLISDACVSLKKPCIFGSVFQIEGQVTTFDNTADGFNYRDLFPIIPPDDVAPKGSEVGILSPLCGVIGSTMAMITLQAILGKPKLIGELLVFNAIEMSFDYLKLAHPQRNTISHFENEIEDNFLIQENQKIDATQLTNFLNHYSAKIIDIRSKQENEICMIPDSISVPLFDIFQKLPLIISDKNQYIILCCKDGNRSRKAMETLAYLGYRHVYLLDGGILSWLVKTQSNQPSY